MPERFSQIDFLCLKLFSPKIRYEHFLLEKLLPVPDETFAFVARWRLVLKVFVASDGLDQIFGEVLKKSKLKDFELKS